MDTTMTRPPSGEGEHDLTQKDDAESRTQRNILIEGTAYPRALRGGSDSLTSSWRRGASRTCQLRGRDRRSEGWNLLGGKGMICPR